MNMFAFLSDKRLDEELDKAMNKYELFALKARRADDAGQPTKAAIYRAIAERWKKRAGEVFIASIR